jgi:hypothetical protein
MILSGKAALRFLLVLGLAAQLCINSFRLSAFSSSVCQIHGEGCSCAEVCAKNQEAAAPPAPAAHAACSLDGSVEEEPAPQSSDCQMSAGCQPKGSVPAIAPSDPSLHTSPFRLAIVLFDRELLSFGNEVPREGYPDSAFHPPQA